MAFYLPLVTSSPLLISAKSALAPGRSGPADRSSNRPEGGGGGGGGGTEPPTLLPVNYINKVLSCET